MERISNCPICDASEFKLFLECKDYRSLRKTFTIVECVSCGFKITNPQLGENRVGEYLESEEISKNGFVRSVQQLTKKYALFKKLLLISKFYKTGKILDVGCGTGEFLKLFKDAKWTTLGIESNELARKTAIEKYGLDIRGEEELKTIQEKSFDVITIWNTLQCVSRLNEYVENIKRILKPKGIIVIAVPNCNSLDAKKYGQYWAAYDVSRHLYHFTPKDIESLFKKHEMNVFRILPEVFHSFSVSMLSEKYRAGKISILKTIWDGFYSNLSALKTGKTYSSQIYLIRK